MGWSWWLFWLNWVIIKGTSILSENSPGIWDLLMDMLKMELYATTFPTFWLVFYSIEVFCVKRIIFYKFSNFVPERGRNFLKKNFSREETPYSDQRGRSVRLQWVSEIWVCFFCGLILAMSLKSSKEFLLLTGVTLGRRFSRWKWFVFLALVCFST